MQLNEDMLAAKQAMATADGFKMAMGGVPTKRFYLALTGDERQAEEMAAEAQSEAIMRQHSENSR